MDSLILFLCGIVLVGTGIFFKKRSIGANAALTEAVNAKVLSFHTGAPNEKPMDATYYPVLEYAFQGRTYRTDGTESVTTSMKEGDVFAIWIDPKNPEKYCLVKGGDTFLSQAAKGFGLFLIVCAGLILFLSKN